MTETVTGEMPTSPAGETPTGQPEPQPVAMTVEQLQAELAKASKALKDANREAAERRKKLEAFEEDERKRKEADLSETDKLKKALQERETELAQLKLNTLKRQIADANGLPAEFAERLRGETEEELTADAKKLAALIPKAPKGNVTNPGGNATTGETDAQRQARLYGSGVQAFDPDRARAHGGGVIWPAEKE